MADRGCDYAWERPSPQALAAAGYTFVCRYLSRDTTGKNLTGTEARALHFAGLSIVLNWEYAPQAALVGYPQGQADARDAVAQCVALGAPGDVPVYFSVDFNPTPWEIDGPVHNYFAGIASVMQVDRVGVYGGLAVVEAVMASGLARYGWQTYAWSGGAWGGAQLRQTVNGVPFQGVNIDVDVSTVDNFGQWKPDGTIGRYDMAGEGFPSLADAEAVMWRLEALVSGSDTVQGGPTAGEPVWIVQHVKALEAKETAEAAPTGGAVTVAGGNVSLSGTFTGSLSGRVTPDTAGQ